MTLIAYQNVPIKDSGEELVDLSKFDFVLDPRYFNQRLATESRMFLRSSVAQKLQAAQRELKTYKFKIWDGFRSRVGQDNIYKKFWQELELEHPEWTKEKLKAEVGVFITDATDLGRIPPHATGGAVDLTLVDSAGKELDMGTGFDYFGPEAGADYFDKNEINQTVRQNRGILAAAMLAQSFVQDSNEWWHFDYGNQLWAMKLNQPFAIYGEVSVII